MFTRPRGVMDNAPASGAGNTGSIPVGGTFANLTIARNLTYGLTKIKVSREPFGVYDVPRHRKTGERGQMAMIDILGIVNAWRCRRPHTFGGTNFLFHRPSDCI